MEFSFGNEVKDGPTTLGMHKKGSMHDIVPVTDCNIVDGDFRKILKFVTDFVTEKGWPFYHKFQFDGFMRHLVIRKGINTGDILVNLVTTSKGDYILDELVEGIKNLELDGVLKTVIHTVNDKVSDIVQPDKIEVM
ncbi:MAG: hypothetical protein MJ246_05685 [Clostridia bacterium]|nr:hypothetical protein [Clostridia bacterium]